MNRFRIVFWAVFAVAGQHPLTARPVAKRTPPPPDLTAVSTEGLIARYQDTSNQSIGSDTLATAEGFVALDEPLKFGGGILGSPQPQVSPVMRELVRRGRTTVPALLAHLNDTRRTKLVLNLGTLMGGIWFGDEYDPKDPSRARLPAGLKLVHELGPFNARSPHGYPTDGIDGDGYHARVGDLCFVTLGQIVNRSLSAARYQPTTCLVLSSPARTPALAAAARADWSKLTDAELKASLIRDIGNRRENAPQTGGLQRMLFYYPDDGKALAVAMLHRPVFPDSVLDAMATAVTAARDKAAQDKILADFQQAHGDVYYQAAVQRLVFETTARAAGPEFGDDPIVQQIRQFHSGAIKLTARRFADVDRHPPPDREFPFLDSQREVVEALASFHAREIDTATRDLLRRVASLPAPAPVDKERQCKLAAECARRFATPAERKDIDRFTDRLSRREQPRAEDLRASREYDRWCDAFLRTLSAN